MKTLRALAGPALCAAALAALPFAAPVKARPHAAVSHAPLWPRAADEPSIAAAAMLEGTWSERRPGSEGATHVEEIWSAPQGDNVVGSFRWVAPSGKATMYELLAITREDEGLFLRLRHFGPDLVAWEERDAPKTLRLTEHGPKRLRFTAHAHCGDLAAVTYDRSETDVLAIEVSFVSESSRDPLRLRLRRGE